VALSWPEIRAADGSIISARVSHSHACDLRCLSPRPRSPPVPGTYKSSRERARSLAHARARASDPKPIVLQLLTALLSQPSRGLVSLPSDSALTPVSAIAVTMPLTARSVGARLIAHSNLSSELRLGEIPLYPSISGLYGKSLARAAQRSPLGSPLDSRATREKNLAGRIARAWSVREYGERGETRT